jgi:hypothetical protein
VANSKHVSKKDEDLKRFLMIFLKNRKNFK